MNTQQVEKPRHVVGVVSKPVPLATPVTTTVSPHVRTNHSVYRREPSYHRMPGIAVRRHPVQCEQRPRRGGRFTAFAHGLQIVQLERTHLDVMLCIGPIRAGPIPEKLSAADRLSHKRSFPSPTRLTSERLSKPRTTLSYIPTSRNQSVSSPVPRQGSQLGSFSCR